MFFSLTASQKQLAFAITGSFNEVDHAKLKAILALLQKISGDASVEIIRIEKGSIKLILGSSEEGLKRIKELFESGQLTEISGDSIEYVHFLDNVNLDEVKSNDNQKKQTASSGKIINLLPSEPCGNVLCSYVNKSSKIQIIRILNISNWYFERIVFPGQRIVFEAPHNAQVEVYTGMMPSAILSETIPSDQLIIDKTKFGDGEEIEHSSAL